MNKPVPLDSLFKEKLFRIPDYQRGYAWQKDQLGDFWEDLLNLDEDRSHYTGVLTLKNIPSKNIKSDSNEYWLVEDHSYNLYYIVDGQQRITTFVIFVQCVIDFLKKLSENVGKSDEEIYLTESLNLEAIAKKYLYEIRPTGIKFRTYKFGYAVDNPSYQFLRYRIFNEQNPGAIQETFYTLNLKNAKTYFIEQLEALYKDEGLAAIQSLYKKLTKNFLFNEYVIETEIDEFIAFETMNNRGKQLSKLELLKNRLIYLATLYPENELDDASRAELRRDINDAWKEIYYQLGRNEKHPLNDDDFLRAHWTMYFKYSRKAADDYIKFLLGEQFSSKKIYKKIEVPVIMDVPIEHKEDISAEDYDKDGSDADNNGEEYVMATSTLSPKEISDYVKNIRASALHWFNSHFPDLASELNSEEKEAIRKLNRVGMLYFRPLVMAVLKSNAKPADRVRLFNKIERFIFICFRLCQARSNYRDSEFYNTAREFDKGEINISQIIKKISDREAWVFNEDGTFNIEDFQRYIHKKFHQGSKEGFCGWSGLKYFLYEYEIKRMKESRQKKVDWSDLLKNERDKISIEHIYPQSTTTYWREAFSDITKKEQNIYNGSLGNLLLLSFAINSSLQNDSFEEKKSPKYDSSGKKIRNGYSDGSHSEIEVSRHRKWGPTQIQNRSLELLEFMEERWDIKIKNKSEKMQLLQFTSD